MGTHRPFRDDGKRQVNKQAVKKAELEKVSGNYPLIYFMKIEPMNGPFSRDGRELMCPSRELGLNHIVSVKE